MKSKYVFISADKRKIWIWLPTSLKLPNIPNIGKYYGTILSYQNFKTFWQSEDVNFLNYSSLINSRLSVVWSPACIVELILNMLRMRSKVAQINLLRLEFTIVIKVHMMWKTNYAVSIVITFVIEPKIQLNVGNAYIWMVVFGKKSGCGTETGTYHRDLYDSNYSTGQREDDSKCVEIKRAARRNQPLIGIFLILAAVYEYTFWRICKRLVLVKWKIRILYYSRKIILLYC